MSKRKLIFISFFLLSIMVLGSLVYPARALIKSAILASISSPDKTDSILLDKRIPKTASVDSIYVRKSTRMMYVFQHGNVLRAYKIGLGKFPLGRKEVQGDYKTPEGLYSIFDKNPNSKYHKNLGISYPNADDKKRAAALHKAPGGDVKIHGLPSDWDGPYTVCDWTWGCIALNNEEIDELYAHTAIGTAIFIAP
jgi:murein L,D-transpeptidase YafK